MLVGVEGIIKLNVGWYIMLIREAPPRNMLSHDTGLYSFTVYMVSVLESSGYGINLDRLKLRCGLPEISLYNQRIYIFIYAQTVSEQKE